MWEGGGGLGGFRVLRGYEFDVFGAFEGFRWFWGGPSPPWASEFPVWSLEFSLRIRLLQIWYFQAPQA